MNGVLATPRYTDTLLNLTILDNYKKARNQINDAGFFYDSFFMIMSACNLLQPNRSINTLCICSSVMGSFAGGLRSLTFFRIRCCDKYCSNVIRVLL
ncbi:hypothetical protein [Vibrio rarus]|uniref:hypothetical protein n=1 Tax=Vibrio rarus TaxID=413403 RepID=UPI0021C282EF|nr:hypothetical protein [Vibrio rarus]